MYILRNCGNPKKHTDKLHTEPEELELEGSSSSISFLQNLLRDGKPARARGKEKTDLEICREEREREKKTFFSVYSAKLSEIKQNLCTTCI